MKLLTWNINGLKTLPYYHPWSDYFKPKGSYEGIISHLDADIVCFQETKITRNQVERNMCIMDEFDCFYSFHSRVPAKGYSGTAVYTKKNTIVPTKAEEGLSGLLKSVASLPETRQILPHPSPLELNTTPARLLDLDLEGRCVIIDLSMFVLINLYCPNETNEDRLEFKNRFDDMLEERIRGLIRSGREVVVVGDMNICHKPIDHCDPDGRMKEHGINDWNEHPSRKWFDNLIGDHGILIDICRRFHPDRQKMFTCWNTKIDARASNYGTRIDYILVTPSLIPWIEYCDIFPNIKGSDHCPVMVTFNDTLEKDGTTYKIWELMNPGRIQGEVVEPPPLAAKFYREFKQSNLKEFFSKKSETSTSEVSISVKVENKTSTNPSSTLTHRLDSTRQSKSKVSKDLAWKNGGESSSQSMESERKELKKKKQSGQTTLMGFLSSSTTGETSKGKKAEKGSKKRKLSRGTDDDEINQNSLSKKSKSERKRERSSNTLSSPEKSTDTSEEVIPAEVLEEMQAVQEDAIHAWSAIFKPPPAPLCTGHGEVAKLWTVNKTGPNKGRKFWMCARPVGKGYDNGQNVADVNPEFRCDFFQWVTTVKRPPMSSVSVPPPKRK